MMDEGLITAAAVELNEMFTSLMKAGFAEHHALYLTGEFLKANVQGPLK